MLCYILSVNLSSSDWFFIPEAHIMYLTVFSWFLSFVIGEAARAGRLSSFMHLSGPSRAIKFIYAPAPPTPTVWALKPFSRALVDNTTYAPIIYTATWIMFWMRAFPLLGQVGGAGPGNLEFFESKLALPYRLGTISQGQKTPDFQGPNPSTCPWNGYARIQNIMHGAV